MSDPIKVEAWACSVRGHFHPTEQVARDCDAQRNSRRAENELRQKVRDQGWFVGTAGMMFVAVNDDGRGRKRLVPEGINFAQERQAFIEFVRSLLG